MKKFTRLLSLCAALAMTVSLAACGGGGEAADTTPTPEATPSGQPVGEGGVALMPVNEVDVAMELTGNAWDSSLFTVNGEEVTAEKYLYFLASNISSYEYYFSMYGMSLDWTQEMDGMTMGQYMKGDGRDTAMFYTLVYQQAKRAGVSLTDEQVAELEASRQDVIDQLGGEEMYVFALQRAALNDETLWWVNAAPYLYQNLQEKYMEANPVSQEELDAHLAENELLRAKHILIAPETVPSADEEGNPYSEEEIAQMAADSQAEALAQAEDILAQLSEAEDPIALFDELMNQYSEDTGLASYPDGYTFGPGEMVAQFEEGTKALGIGEISGLIGSDYGFHIILRLEPAAEEVATYNANLKAEYEASVFSAYSDTWMEEAQVVYTDAYEAIDAQSYYEALLAYQAEMDAANGGADDGSEAAPESSDGETEGENAGDGEGDTE